MKNKTWLLLPKAHPEQHFCLNSSPHGDYSYNLYALNLLKYSHLQNKIKPKEVVVR